MIQAKTLVGIAVASILVTIAIVTSYFLIQGIDKKATPPKHVFRTDYGQGVVRANPRHFVPGTSYYPSYDRLH